MKPNDPAGPTRNESYKWQAKWCFRLGLASLVCWWMGQLSDGGPVIVFRRIMLVLSLTAFVFAIGAACDVNPRRKTRAARNNEPIVVAWRQEQAQEYRRATILFAISLVLLAFWHFTWSMETVPHFVKGTAGIVGFLLLFLSGGMFLAVDTDTPEVLDIPDLANAPTSATFGSAGWASPDDLKQGDLL